MILFFTDKSDMTECIKVKEEPINDFEDALRTLASAAVAQDSLPQSELQLLNEFATDSMHQNRIPSNTTELHLALTVEQESDSKEAHVHESNPSLATMTEISVSEPPWFDVGYVRNAPFAVQDFYFSVTSIDHSSDTSECLPNYAGLNKHALLPGTAYKFRVAAVNACGIGEWSDVVAFKTCSPGYPGAPRLLQILRMSEGAMVKWDAPLLRYGKIVEYSLCLAIKNRASGDGNANNMQLRDFHFVRVYCGIENCAFVENSSLEAAYIDRRHKPAILFRIAARNEKGYGPATQVKWLQESGFC